MNHQETRLDQQFAELMEVVWACETQWTRDDHVDACIKYGDTRQ